MRPLRDLTSKMENGTSVENLRILSSPERDLPATVRCFDPARPDQACPLCNGLGLLSFDVPYGHADFNRVIPCPNRPPDTERQQKLRRLGNLETFADKTLDNFEISRAGYKHIDIQSLTNAYRISVQYAARPEGWLLFEGSYGTGKTHLAAAVGNARLNVGENVMFMTTPDLLDHLRAGFNAGSENSYDAVFERVKETPLLILDDLGAENPSAWAMEKLFQLLNHRYTALLPTIITTNTPLEKLDGRLSSRLRDTQVVNRIVIHAPDYRDANAHTNADLMMRLGAYHAMTFDTFDVQSAVTQEEASNLRNALRVSQEFARSPTGWLIFCGSYGAGKTHLAASIANFRQMRHEEQVTFITMPDLLDFLKASFNPDAARNFDELFDTLRNMELLVLDDLNLDNAKAWAQEKLFQLLDYRYVRRMPTVITTSRSMDDLERTSPRLVSRLTDSRTCRIVGIQARSYGIRLKTR